MRFGRQSALAVAAAAAATAAPADATARGGGGGGGGKDGIIEGLFNLHDADDYILHGWTASLLLFQVVPLSQLPKSGVILLLCLFICE